MKISQILIQPIGQRFNAGTLTIKTCKKTWQVKEVFYHQVIFMDETGEIPADVKIGNKYIPLQRGKEVNIIIAEVREAEYLGKPRKILFVDQYSLPTMMVDDFNAQEEDWSRIQQDQIKGKIRHGLVCSLIQAKEIALEPIAEGSKKLINDMVDFIMTGE
jgi:hypothetical protein